MDKSKPLSKTTSSSTGSSSGRTATTTSSSTVKRVTTTSSSSSPTSSTTTALKSKPLSSITSVPRAPVTSKHASLPNLPSSISSGGSISSSSRVVTPSTTTRVIRKPLTSSSSTTPTTTTRTTSTSSSTTNPTGRTSTTRTTTSRSTLTSSSSTRPTTTTTSKTLTQRPTTVSRTTTTTPPNTEQKQPVMIDLTSSTSSTTSSNEEIQSPEFDRVVSEFIVLDEPEEMVVGDEGVQQDEEEILDVDEYQSNDNLVVEEEGDAEGDGGEEVTQEDYPIGEQNEEELLDQSATLTQPSQQQPNAEEKAVEEIDKKNNRKSGWFTSFLNLLPSASTITTTMSTTIASSTNSMEESTSTTTQSSSSSSYTILQKSTDVSNNNTVSTSTSSSFTSKNNITYETDKEYISTNETQEQQQYISASNNNYHLSSTLSQTQQIYVENVQQQSQQQQQYTEVQEEEESIIYKPPPLPVQSHPHHLMHRQAHHHQYQQTHLQHQYPPQYIQMQQQPPPQYYQSTPNLLQFNRNSVQIPQHLMYPHNQPNGVALLPFIVSPTKAINIFQDWYKSLWFAPTNFRDQLEKTLEISYLFVPYYAFTVVVTSTHRGRVGHLRNNNQQALVVDGNSGKSLSQAEEIEWSRATSHPYTQTHNDVLVYSPVGLSNDKNDNNGQTCSTDTPPPYVDTKEIAYWKIEFTEPFHSQHPQLNVPITDILPISPQLLSSNSNQNLLTSSSSSSINNNNNINNNQPQQQSNTQNFLRKDPNLYKIAKPLDKIAWEEAWKYAEIKIKRNECYGNDQKLKRDHMAHIVSDVETNTTFDNITYRTIFMPIYNISYVFEGERYTFIINGQNGNSYGERPYGIGSIKNTAIRFLTAGIFEKTGSAKIDKQTVTSNGMVKGSDLNQIDGDELYHADRFYLLLPASDQFLLIKTIGFVTLKNNGLSDLVLESHRRMSDELGGECILAAGESQTFTFKGCWCVGIQKGDPSSLELIRVETNGGGDKPTGDLFMA